MRKDSNRKIHQFLRIVQFEHEEYPFFEIQTRTCARANSNYSTELSTKLPLELLFAPAKAFQGFQKENVVPQGDKSAYTDKQKRQAQHIEEGYKKRGVPEKEAARRAWATENRISGGGKKSGSGRGNKKT